MSKNYINKSKIEFEFWNHDIYENKEELSIQIISNGIIQPYKENVINNKVQYPRYGGVFNENFEICENSMLLWQNPKVANKPTYSIGKINLDDIKNIKYIDEEVIYLGHLDKHFGHFLVDSTTRLWIYLDEKYKNKKAVYISDGNDKFLDFFFIFGLNRENIIRIDNITKFKKVIVPEPSFKFHFEYHKKFKETFDKIRENVKGKRFKKIYLSRSKLSNNIKCYGEDKIEKIFKSNGYKIIYPEKLSLKKQIMLMKNVTHIAGITGSACHLSLFSKDNINACFINRNQGNFVTQLFINKMKNFNASFIDAFINPLPVGSYGTPYLIGLNKYLRNYFDEHNFKYNKKDKIITNENLLNFIITWKDTTDFLDCNDSFSLKNLADNLKEIIK